MAARNPSFWVRNRGMAAFGVTAYLMAGPAFGFFTGTTVTFDHRATTAEDFSAAPSSDEPTEEESSLPQLVTLALPLGDDDAESEEGTPSGGATADGAEAEEEAGDGASDERLPAPTPVEAAPAPAPSPLVSPREVRVVPAVVTDPLQDGDTDERGGDEPAPRTVVAPVVHALAVPDEVADALADEEPEGPEDDCPESTPTAAPVLTTAAVDETDDESATPAACGDAGADAEADTSADDDADQDESLLG